MEKNAEIQRKYSHRLRHSNANFKMAFFVRNFKYIIHASSNISRVKNINWLSGNKINSICRQNRNCQVWQEQRKVFSINTNMCDSICSLDFFHNVNLTGPLDLCTIKNALKQSESSEPTHDDLQFNDGYFFMLGLFVDFVWRSGYYVILTLYLL